MRQTAPRQGYATVLVLLFMVLFFSLWSVAYRHTAAALRFETVQAQRLTRDQGCSQALARALALLETDEPPSSPYVCGLTVNTLAGPQSITVTFTSDGSHLWSVNASPTAAGISPPPMPVTFIPGLP